MSSPRPKNPLHFKNCADHVIVIFLIFLSYNLPFVLIICEMVFLKTQVLVMNKACEEIAYCCFPSFNRLIACQLSYFILFSV